MYVLTLKQKSIFSSNVPRRNREMVLAHTSIVIYGKSALLFNTVIIRSRRKLSDIPKLMSNIEAKCVLDMSVAFLLTSRKIL